MRGFRIGRVFGIELRVDWSWVFIFVLLTWNLVAIFTTWHPAWTPAGTVAIAACGSLAFFGCIVLHEFAHAVVARSYGMRVGSITLFLFGGVSNIEKEPPSAKAEFFMAIVGPILSIGLGIGFLALASAAAAFPTVDATPGWSTWNTTWNGLARLGPITTLLVWLGPVNIIIGLFNLLPGFPLDGGRVLRSFIWQVTGNLRVATLWASATGSTIGWLLIAAGIAMSFGVELPFFGTGLVGGIWLAFIGWFLHNAAMQASTRLALDDALAGMTVEQLMRRQGPTAAPNLTVAALVHDYLIQSDDRALPVVQDDVLLGLVSTSDVRAVPPERWAATPVASIMHPASELSVAAPEEPLAKAFEELAQRNVEQLPVVTDGNKLVGMLRRADISRWLELAWKPSAGTRDRSAPSSTWPMASRTFGRGGSGGVHHPV